MDPGLEALWKRVLDRWEDDSVHSAFLDYCQRTEQLVDAAVRYRGMAGDRDRADSAKKRLAAISVLALAKLESTRTPRPTAGRRSTMLVLAMLILSVLAAILMRLGTLLE